MTKESAFDDKRDFVNNEKDDLRGYMLGFLAALKSLQQEQSSCIGQAAALRQVEHCVYKFMYSRV